MTPEPEVKKMIPIDRVVEYKPVQARVRLSTSTVQDYEGIILETGSMDPVTVWKIGEGFPEDLKPEGSDGKLYFLLSDGHHRLNAYRNLDKKVIPAEVREGTLSQALQHAITANRGHGLQFTNSDKRRAAELAVADPELGKLKDAEIAKLIRVSPGFINTVRRGVKPADVKKRRERKSGGRAEKESTAPKTATARQRKEKTEDDKRPTAAACLRTMEEWLRLDIVDETAIIKHFETGSGCYRWMVKDKGRQMLKVVNRQGTPLIEAEVIIESVNEAVIVVSGSEKDFGK